jgi:nucleoside-diphosphate-sugar epimerase
MGKLNIKVEIVSRSIADLIIFNTSLVIGLSPQLLTPHAQSFSLFGAWWPSACIVSILGPLLFYAMGIYTKGRFYAGRYKALIVAQAATLVFGSLLLCLYFFRLQPSFPRSALLLAWVCACVLLLGARLWGQVWRHVVNHENSTAGVSVISHPKNVLVIGGAGYIGSALIPKLLDRGYRVRLLDCFLYGQDPIKPFMAHPNLEIHEGDFRNVDTVVAAMRDMTSVIHLGAIVGDPACALDEELTIQINLIATRMIVQVAKGNGIKRFVFASSCSVYGASNELLNERSSLNPVSLYARSKIASENVLMSFRGGDFEPVILRFGTIYGLSGRTRFDLVVNLLAAKALVEKVVTVFGKDQWRPFLHVHDAGRSILAALDAPSEAVSSIVFNVGCDEQNRTLGQIGTLITSMVPGSVLVCTEESVDPRNYRVEFRRIRESLGFQPVWTVEAGVQQVLDAIRAGKILDYQDARYSNVKFLSAPNVRMHLPVIEDWVAECLLQSGEVMAAHA